MRPEHRSATGSDQVEAREDRWPGASLEERVVRAAEAVLAEQQYVSAVDVLVRLGWLAPSHVDQWRQGRAQCLEQLVQANLAKTSKSMAHLRRWAGKRGLVAGERLHRPHPGSARTAVRSAGRRRPSGLR